MTNAPKSYGRKSISATRKPQDLMAPKPLLNGVWTAHIVTLFPQSFPGVLGHSLTGRALDTGRWCLETIDLREFGLTKHKNVDDTPAGGGAGMVLRADVVGPAIETALERAPQGTPIFYLSPRGKQFTQETAREWSQRTGVILLCGRFEGVDQRVLDHYNIQEISLGDFVLTGGEIAAQAMLDATVRLLPDVIGNAASLDNESHANGLLEHPQYTRPSVWKSKPIPDVIMSGHHENIEKWRHEQSLEITRQNRPDLYNKYKK